MKVQQALMPPTLFPDSARVARPAASDAPAGSGVGTSATAARPFSAVLEQSREGAARQVRSGETLLGLVREQAAQRGLRLTDAQGVRLAQQLARDSGIADPNRIFPGQTLALEGLQTRLAALSAGAPSSSTASLPAAQALAQAVAGSAVGEVRVGARQKWAAAAYGVASRAGSASLPAAARATAAAPAEPASARPHPVLEQTLDRAVARGFIPAIERGDVYDKILQLAARHRFKPDDFARLTLVESDGMNPRSSNDRCHGIIQFCDGNDRGAATVGHAANPRAILGYSVYQQLHLVDRYFSEVNVRPSTEGTASLDELYLAVLMPSARGVTGLQAPLGIAGTQASVLHPGRDRTAPITRQSLLDGLQQYATERLSGSRPRAQAQALSDEALPAALGGTRLR